MVESENWPNDADGDVMRRLRNRRIDFAKRHRIDFNIDFESWPPPAEAIALLRQKYESVTVYAPSDGAPGGVMVQMEEVLSYDFVVQMQSMISEAMAPFGGVCEAWGLLTGAGT